MGYKDDNYSTKVCGHHPETCTCRDWDTKEEPKQEHCDCRRAYKEALSGICELCWDEKYPTKQETVEEAIYKIFKSKEYSNLESNPNAYGFMLAGAQEGAKWQESQMYSEEEVTQLLIKFNQEIYEVEDVRGWFEQFKKK